ncbi:MAG: hypothetical protein O7J95_19010, partial [Planctomycetota bacterium]|nr:hypothetical protein [Planctomycetota bacterium]
MPMETTVMNVFPEVERDIIDLLDEVSPDPREIDRKIADLARRLGPRVYSELLYILCHLSFPPRVARSHWSSMLEHQEALSHRLGATVDFRVALLDYFISVNQHFDNPKIIEIRIFQKTQDSAIK